MEKLEKIVNSLLLNASEITNAGGFAEITLSLPLRSLAELEEKTTVPEPRDESQPLKLLLLEDNPDDSNYSRETFADSHQVLEAINRHIKLLIARKQVPEIIISYLRKPEMDGSDLYRIMKATPGLSHIPVVLITAQAKVGPEISSWHKRAGDAITKPSHGGGLARMVKSLIEQRKKVLVRSGEEFTMAACCTAVSSTDKKFLHKVFAIMEENVCNCNFDVEFLCSAVGKSRMQLHRKFKDLTGQSPGKFIQTYRLKKALMLLDQHAGNISEVAYSVGFNSLTYFTKCFRETYGKTPSEYLARKEPVANGR